MAMTAPVVHTATCSAGSNLAVIKYWGKASKALNTPINSSVSVALNQDDLCTVTTVAASKSFSSDRLWLNDSEEDITGNKRVQVVLREMRRLAQDYADESGKVLVASADWADYKVHIVSRNNFPTAAGLASSAAGYACMVASLAELFCCKEAYPGELSCVARQGSGSACRSMYGGFVRWQKGEKADGSDSHAVQVAPADHWPDMQVLILVANVHKKETSSTDGMSTSVATSPLLKHRAEHIVPPRLQEIEAAFLRRDFPAFGKLAMQDSNQFHATCLDTYPPIFYMNETSHRIVALVHKYNEHAGQVKAAYTFDAGPNAVIFVERKDAAHLLAFLLLALPNAEQAQSLRPYVNDPKLRQQAALVKLEDGLLAIARARRSAGRLAYIMHTTVGSGPRRLVETASLVDAATGMPKCDNSAASDGAGAIGARRAARGAACLFGFVAAASHFFLR